MSALHATDVIIATLPPEFMHAATIYSICDQINIRNNTVWKCYARC